MNCSIGNVVAAHPVVGRLTGRIYERSTIEKALEQEGKCPVTGTAMTKDDLIEVKQEPTGRVALRSVETTSIPSLLAAFQDEWDAMALESFKLRELLNKTRKQLSQSLYQHDAACRVVSRLVRERDEARAALSSVTIAAKEVDVSPSVETSPQQTTSTSPMPIVPLSKEESAKVEARSEELKAARSKKRKKLTGIGHAVQWQAGEPLSGSCVALDYIPATDSLALAARDGKIQFVKRSTREHLSEVSLAMEAPPIGICTYDDDSVVVGAGNGSLWALNSSSGATSAHMVLPDAMTGFAVHACRELLVTCHGDANSWSLVRLTACQIAQQIKTNMPARCIDTHPDGAFCAIGGSSSGSIEVFDILSGQSVAQVEVNESNSPVSQLRFAENGVNLASCSAMTSVAKMWDMRRLDKPVFTYEETSCMNFDTTGTVFACSGPSNVRLYDVQKKGEWSRVFETAAPQEMGIVSIHPDKAWLIGLLSDGTVLQWE